MGRTLMLIATGPDVGLSTVALGLVRTIDTLGLRVGFCKPVAQYHQQDSEQEHTTAMVKSIANIETPTPITLSTATDWLSKGKINDLLEELVARYEPYKQQADVMVVEALVPTKEQSYANKLNAEIIKALDANIILVASDHPNQQAFTTQLELAMSNLGALSTKNILGVIVNKVGITEINSKSNMAQYVQVDHSAVKQRAKQYAAVMPQSIKPPLKLLGAIPFDANFMAPRVSDIARHLAAQVLYEGELSSRRVSRISLCARSMENMTGTLKAGSLIITAGDRSDIIVATAMAAINGINLAGIILTGNYRLKKGVIKLCHNALKTGLPVLAVKEDSLTTVLNLNNFSTKIPLDDVARIEVTTSNTVRYIHYDWLQQLVSSKSDQRLSPPAFRYQLIKQAKAADKRIVLPEGNEPRTIAAAAICSRRGIARCVLLGKRDEIRRTALNQNISLGDAIEIIDPDDIRQHYVAPMVELRKHRQLTPAHALDYLHDNVMLGTMMLQQGDVDGLVSGAQHTTANTIRPALQLIKTAASAQLVSSIFFMCLPDQVLIYGDCAVNPNPNAAELADIAIQSADSANAFGIEPRVAMISYSTGTSGVGQDVDKVRQATELVKQSRPDICIDGPLQYDAAFMENVAKQKAPDSPVAGKATVFVFPDLNTGNTTYKAVQRSANVICIGPMLQGLRKPVNDLSRGALVDDIVFTIAITAIQAIN